MTMTPTMTLVTRIEGLAARLTEAYGLVAQVSPVLGIDNHYVVRNAQGYYLVANGKCTCPDAKYRREVHQGWCKHRLAAALYQDTVAVPQQQG